jgi:membrane-bound metal-dependent hydrolase YbcI (DUF457 family)
MDILTHICSGIAGATVVAAFVKQQPAKRLKILVAGAAGGAFPDIDAISMWSQFDSTIGRFFNLSHTGRVIYGEKFWYSHHAFFHSLVAALLIALLLGVLSYSIHRIRHNKTGYKFAVHCKSNFPLMITFIAGYLFHLLGDMPTPASVWGGVNLFWPDTTYIGGSGKIWWWNNYDVFLLLVSCIAINAGILSVFKQPVQRVAIILVAVFIFILIEIQINIRQYDYAYSGNSIHYSEMEQHSKEEQKRILGERIYLGMAWLDNHLPIHF